MDIFIWAIALLFLFIFIRYHLYPFLKRKILFWYFSAKVRQMSKGERDEEERQRLKDIAKGLDEVNKNTKL